MKKAHKNTFKLTDLKNLYLDNSKQKLQIKENKKRNERIHKIDNKRFGHIQTINNEEISILSSNLQEISIKLTLTNNHAEIESALSALDDLFDQDIPLTNEVVNQLIEILDKLIKLTMTIFEVSFMVFLFYFKRLTISNINYIILLDNVIIESFSNNNYQHQQIINILQSLPRDCEIIFDLFQILSVLFEKNPNEPKYSNLIRLTLFYKNKFNDVEFNQIFYSIFENYLFHSNTLEIEKLFEILELMIKDLYILNDPEPNLFYLLVEVFQKFKFQDFLHIFHEMRFSTEISKVLYEFSSQKEQVVGIALHYFEISLLAESTFDHQKLFEEICKYLQANKSKMDMSILSKFFDNLKLLFKNNKMIPSDVLFDKSSNFLNNLLFSINHSYKEINYEVIELINRIVCNYGVDFYNYSVEIDDSIFLWLKTQLNSNDESFLISVLRELEHIVENDTLCSLEIYQEISSIKDKLEIIFYKYEIHDIKSQCSKTFKLIKKKYYL